MLESGEEMDGYVRRGGGVSNGEEPGTCVKGKRGCGLKDRLGHAVEDLQCLMGKMSR